MRKAAFAVSAGLLLSACSQTPPDSAQPGLQVPLATTDKAQVEQAVTAISTFPTELAPDVWTDGKLNPELRNRALALVKQNAADLGVSDLVVDDVQLQGSIASYEYDQLADFGIHVMVHSPSLSRKQLQPVLGTYNDFLNISQEPYLSYYGYPVEVSFWASDDPHAAAGEGIPVYSIESDKWITKPVAQPDNFDRAQMTTDAQGFIAQYNALASEYAAGKIGFKCSRLDDLGDEMKDYRAAAFDAGQGSRSTGNLTYRALRRLNINLPDTLDALEADCQHVNESVYAK